ncbi:hypothetical protein V8G54_000346 [Vigna mungo]|uniref:Uncharacterized protein n=1 Tax=Vigna mungo TaxID=3915 RepID=A0AAQ3P6X0_VIGMU
MSVSWTCFQRYSLQAQHGYCPELNFHPTNVQFQLFSGRVLLHYESCVQEFFLLLLCPRLVGFQFPSSLNSQEGMIFYQSSFAVPLLRRALHPASLPGLVSPSFEPCFQVHVTLSPLHNLPFEARHGKPVSSQLGPMYHRRKLTHAYI